MSSIEPKINTPFSEIESISKHLEQCISTSPSLDQSKKEISQDVERISGIVKAYMPQLIEDIAKHPAHADVWKKISGALKKSDVRGAIVYTARFLGFGCPTSHVFQHHVSQHHVSQHGGRSNEKAHAYIGGYSSHARRHDARGQRAEPECRRGSPACATSKRNADPRAHPALGPTRVQGCPLLVRDEQPGIQHRLI